MYTHTYTIHIPHTHIYTHSHIHQRACKGAADSHLNVDIDILNIVASSPVC